MPATAVESKRLGWHPASWSAGMIGVIVLAVAAGAFVAVSSSSGHHSSTPASVAPATQPELGGEQTPTDSQTGTETSSTATTQTKTSPPQGAEPLAALTSYWADIKAHEFAGAWAYLAPGAVEMTEEQFISSEQGAHISDVKFHGNVRSSSGASATVAVVSLITHDRQFGCRTWTGSYEMTDDERGWQIAHAILSPSPCSG
jgi:hypothetical protein